MMEKGWTIKHKEDELGENGGCNKLYRKMPVIIIYSVYTIGVDYSANRLFRRINGNGFKLMIDLKVRFALHLFLIHQPPLSSLHFHFTND